MFFCPIYKLIILKFEVKAQPQYPKAIHILFRLCKFTPFTACSCVFWRIAILCLFRWAVDLTNCLSSKVWLSILFDKEGKDIRGFIGYNWWVLGRYKGWCRYDACSPKGSRARRSQKRGCSVKRAGYVSVPMFLETYIDTLAKIKSTRMPIIFFTQ